MFLTALLASHVILWNFEPKGLSENGNLEGSLRDVLEYQDVLGDEAWHEVPGPYELTPDRKDYAVFIAADNWGNRFFRLRREWGEPWVIPMVSLPASCVERCPCCGK